MEDDLKKKIKKWRQPQKQTKNEDDLKKNGEKNEDDLKKKLNKNEDDLKKNIFLIPLKFRGEPFLGLAQLSKILSIKTML